MPHYLIAADADWILDEVRAALEGPDSSITVCRAGQQVVPTVKGREPDLALLDLQIGSMGGMAVTMELRLEESGGRLPHIPVLMLLDRQADVFLASRAGAEGWLIKPLDSLRLRKAATTLTSGGTYYEGLPKEEPPVSAFTVGDTVGETVEEAADETAGRPPDADSADGTEALSG